MTLSNDDIRLLRGRYEEQRPAYARLAADLHEALARIVGRSGVRHYLITHRAKSPDSLHDKLVKHRGDNSLSDFDEALSPPLNDLAAARVLVYLLEDQQVVVDAIQRAFSQADHAVREPKLRKGKKDYNAVHVYLSSQGGALTVPDELSKRPPEVEVQVTTLAHHLWNELNHDIRYKQLGGEPDEAQRELLDSLAAEVHLVLETAGRLMARTNERIRKNEQPITGPAELRVHLEGREKERHPLSGDFQGLFDLLNALVDPLTPAWLDGCFKHGMRPHPSGQLSGELDPQAGQGEVRRLLVRLLPKPWLECRRSPEDGPPPRHRRSPPQVPGSVRLAGRAR
ncbi:MAG: hypothetical protein GXP62_13255, partial [Oligoflexia bacterium]|nr:hypothetical protein [Oligoflexia bacterium]